MLSRVLDRPASTIGKVLRRAGCSRLPGPDRVVRQRYERERPGELLHVDIKKLGRFWEVGKRIRKDGIKRSRHAGWSYLHIAIDDHSRLAYAELLQDERGPSCAAFLRRASGWYAERGITIERVLSDNARAYHGNYWIAACDELAIARRYTKPYSPWTNGKAEAFIKTMLREWAYRHSYPTSSHRARALSGYLRWYNNHRPHGSLAALPPISRVSHVRGYST
jgi:transposase InsO family protein